jgi:hypothetical protein
VNPIYRQWLTIFVLDRMQVLLVHVEIHDEMSVKKEKNNLKIRKSL